MANYLEILVNSFLNGIGNAIGVYFIAKHFLSRIDKKEKEEKEEKKIL